MSTKKVHPFSVGIRWEQGQTVSMKTANDAVKHEDNMIGNFNWFDLWNFQYVLEKKSLQQRSSLSTYCAYFRR